MYSVSTDLNKLSLIIPLSWQTITTGAVLRSAAEEQADTGGLLDQLRLSGRTPLLCSGSGFLLIEYLALWFAQLTWMWKVYFPACTAAAASPLLLTYRALPTRTSLSTGHCRSTSSPYSVAHHHHGSVASASLQKVAEAQEAGFLSLKAAPEL